MMYTRKHVLVFFAIFGIFLVPVGNIMTIQGRFAKGDDASIYLVDFDETAYDLYLKGYYPSDYTYADFRRDSIESMTSHYVATDSNNFTAIVDTIENDVLQNGWSVIDNFFEDAWINLKSGDITVVKGFTDDFKHTLDGRLKSSAGSTSVTVGSGTWIYIPAGGTSSWITKSNGVKIAYGNLTSHDVWVGRYMYSGSPWGVVACSYVSGGTLRVYYNSMGSYDNVTASGTYATGEYYLYRGLSETDVSNTQSYYASLNAALADFFNHSPSVPVGSWNGDGYYSDTPTDYIINLPALPFIDWPSISTNNKTKYGVDFPDVDLTIDFQLPDSYYPQSVTYDTPYWLYNTDSTPVDWQNVSFDDVTLPEVQLSDGDGSFFQALFNTLPLAFVPILLGVILCYLIFLML